MEIILLEGVEGLGKLGDIVQVKNGYARNFLVPQGKACRATKENRQTFEARRVELEKIQADVLSQARTRAADLAGAVVTIRQKAGVDGRLFGSVTAQDVACAFTEAGMPVKKLEVHLSHGPLKQIGEHSVSLVLHHDVHVDVSVHVIAE